MDKADFPERRGRLFVPLPVRPALPMNQSPNCGFSVGTPPSGFKAVEALRIEEVYEDFAFPA
jgi:hypothetical protein